MKPLTHKQATEIAGALSYPSKMPGPAYSLPAEECKTGSKLAQVEGTVCHECYAMKGNYTRFAKVIKPSQYKHLEAVKHPKWVSAMVTLIRSACQSVPYFRWHDSGDIQNAAHLARIADIATQLSHIHFWIATREYAFVNQFLETAKLPDNLTVRMSAHRIDGPIPDMHDLPGSGVHTAVVPANAYVCPAPEQGGHCGDCRACWNNEIKRVSYRKH